MFQGAVAGAGAQGLPKAIAITHGQPSSRAKSARHNTIPRGDARPRVSLNEFPSSTFPGGAIGPA